MLRITRGRSSTLLQSNRCGFSLFNSLLHYVRTALNRVRWEENQQFTSIEQRASNVPKTAEQASQLFVATQQRVGLSEVGRLQRIDQILGTNTHFHEGKVYQERIDSDHLMEIEQLKKENPEQKRESLNWLNPQAEGRIRYKNKRNHYRLISKLSSYPAHQPGSYDLADEVDERTITFLAKETAYSTLSLKPMELTAASLELEGLLLPSEVPFQSQRYSYFRPQFSMQLLRVPKTLYTSSLLTDQTAIAALGSLIEEVISLEDIYEALKPYYTDERVHEYLRRVENNRIEYLFADLALDRTEDTVAVTIDILDNGIEHCLLVKSLVSKQTLRPLFNLKPPVVFSPDGKAVLYIQRSAEGGWIQLVKRPTESCWGGSEVVLSEEDEGIIYRCSPEKELKLGKDSNNNFVFMMMKDYAHTFSQSLFVLSLKEGGLKPLPVDEGGNCQYSYDMSPMGLIFGRKRAVKSGQLKYGENQHYIEQVELVPFKKHVQIQVDKLGLTELLPGLTVEKGPDPEELDFTNKKCIFVADEHQFITQIEVRSTHLVMTLNYASVYDRAILYFLPYKASAHPHSLILKGGSQLKLRGNTYTYDSQTVEFSQPQGPLLIEKVYNIWKRQLSNEERWASRYHHEVMRVSEHSRPFEIHFMCKQMYLSEKQLPVMLVMTSRGEQIDQQILRQFLEKGVAVVQFCGRGTFSHDLEHFLAGSRHNFGQMLDDLQAVIEFIGNKMTRNISLYCKGQISSLAGLWFNIYFPYLFNASVLHNGLYDLKDQTALNRCLDFMGPLKAQDDGVEVQRFNLDKFNFFEHRFKRMASQRIPLERAEGQSELEVGEIENVIISSDGNHHVHSRRLVRRLRESPSVKYETVFMREHEEPYSADLHNLSFIYGRIRERLEREVDQLGEDEDSEDN